uniref:Uncharacterized protein n=1 Tax=Triticum urartu TaxID=4572 RepID=A0A8R7U891_TRIUA
MRDYDMLCNCLCKLGTLFCLLLLLFTMSIFFKLLLLAKKLACMLSAKIGMLSPKNSRRVTEPTSRRFRPTLTSTNDATNY